MENERGKIGLVLEGGGYRGLFTAGILDYLLSKGVDFDGMVGVSSGVLFGCNFKSRQAGRTLNYNLKFKDDPRYMGLGSWIKTGNYVNERFSYYELPYFRSPFDFETFRNNPMEFYSVCTDIVNGSPEYHRIDDAKGEGMQWMRASASMPFFAKPVPIEDNIYLDGGMTDSVPLRFFQNKGFKKNVVILTQPRGYRKKWAPVYLPLRLLLNKYPKVAILMSNRYKIYNKQMEYLEEQEREGDTFLIYPDKHLSIGRIERNENKMIATYEAGVAKAMSIFSDLQKFLDA